MKIGHIFIARSSITVESFKAEICNVNYQSFSCLLAIVSCCGLFILHTGGGSSNRNVVRASELIRLTDLLISKLILLNLA